MCDIGASSQSGDGLGCFGCPFATSYGVEGDGIMQTATHPATRRERGVIMASSYGELMPVRSAPIYAEYPSSVQCLPNILGNA